AQVAGHRVVVGVGVAGAGEVNLQETAGEDVEVVAGDVFAHARPADAGFEVHAERAAGQFAVLDAHPADAGGDLAADADAREGPAAQRASGDRHVFDRLPHARPFSAAAGLEADAIIAGVDVAALDAHAAAGVHVNPVPAAADRHVLDRNA